MSQERERISPEPKEWVKPSRRGRGRGAWFYVDGFTMDDALLTLPEIVKQGIKDPKDLPDIKRVRFRRNWMKPGKIILTLKVLPEEKKE